MSTESAQITEQIRARYRSIHAFCRAHPELKRATVYQVLAGRYAGNTDKQLARIRILLETNGAALPDHSMAPRAERVSALLQDCKCTHCRRTDRRDCRGCRRQTEREVRALQELWG